MNWGRNNSSSISQVFSMSWFSKFKQTSKKDKFQTQPPKTNPKPKSRCVRDNEDSESFWQISFGGSSPQGKSHTDCGNHDLHDFNDDDVEISISSCQSCGSSTREVGAKEGAQSFTDMVRNMRYMRGMGTENREDTPRRRINKGRKLDKIDRKISEEVNSEAGGESAGISQRLSFTSLDSELMEAVMKLEKEYECSRNARRTRRTSKEDETREKLEVVEEEEDSDNGGAELENKLAKDAKIKPVQRKSVHINREVQKRRANQSSKVKVRSPRTPPKVEICKIKALEDMKKERAKKNDRSVAKDPGLERFAVTKCTFDPQKDFRDSMMEMIVEEGIRKPEELENLLACYLTLNSDEYHDFIVSAFRQVWLMHKNLVNS